MEKDYKNEVFKSLSPYFDFIPEVKGTHFSGKKLYLDHIIKPKSNLHWKNKDVVFGVEYKDTVRIDGNTTVVSSRVTTIGYINTDGKAIDYNENGKYTVEWKINFVSSGGVVREIHHESRDSSNLNFPCVHSNCRVDGGMSGGPVFDHNGNMFGINSMSLHPNDESEEHVSYAALIWPTLHWSFDVHNRKTHTPMKVTLFEFIRGSSIRTTGLECFEIINNEKEKVIGTKMTCQRLLLQKSPPESPLGITSVNVT